MRSLLLLVLILVIAVASAAQCEAPFRTLSSDCRGYSHLDGKRACVVVERRDGQACDIRTYRLDFTPSSAHFQITFQSGSSSRQLMSASGSLRLFAQLSTSEGSSAGSGSSEATSTPPSSPSPVPTPPQTTTVDYPPRPPTDDPPAPPGGPADTPVTTPTPSPLPIPGPVTFNPGSILATENNEFVDAIGRLELPSTLTQVRIFGGSSERGTRGHVVRLTIDPQMLTLSKSVISLSISNCNIGSQLATGSVLSAMPVELVELQLRNTLLRQEPNDLSALQNLQSLKMEQNYMAALTNRISLPKLTVLDLSENELTTFEGNFPALNVLYLSKNKLDTIPTAVYSMRKLQDLYLSENRIIEIVVSDSQYAFLGNIRVTIDKPPTTPPQPVVYVPTPTSGSIPSDATSLVLNSKNIDFANAVAVPVGTSKTIGAFPVWTLPDGVYEVFVAQQEAISKSNVTIGGKKTETYKTVATSAASKADRMDGSLESDQRLGSLPQARTSTTTSEHADDGRDNSKVGEIPSAPIGDAGAGEVKPGIKETTPPGGASVNERDSESKSHKTLIITLVAAVAAAVFVTVIFFVHRRHRNDAKSDVSSLAATTTPQDGSSLSSYQSLISSKSRQKDSMGSFGSSFIPTQDADLRDLLSSRRIRTTDLEDVRPITSTGTDVTWLVKMRGSRLLTSKRMIESAATPMRITEFVNEIIIAADLDHPSIVRLVGVAWTSETDLQALYEHTPNGDLETYLHETEPSSLLWSPTKVRLAIDIVEALVYTHSFNPPLLHRDLRARNVLLNEEMNPKLGNFGFARFASEQNTMTTDGIGSGRWLAPEVLRGCVDYAAASDVYSLGVLLSELDTHKLPYQDARHSSGNAMMETALLERVARGELRPTFSTECPREIVEVAGRCLSQDPVNRPTAIQIVYEMRVCLRELDDRQY